MAHADEVKRKVRANYVQGLPLNTASESEGVSYNTARNWKRAAAVEGDDWDVARSARRLTKSGMEEMVHQVLPQLTQQFAATIKLLEEDKKLEGDARARILLQLTDGYAKALAASARAAPSANRLAAAMDVIRFITELVARHAPKMHQAFFELVREHGEDIAREFGGGARH